MGIPRRLDYQQLLYFWSVVRTGGITRAANELALSPTAQYSFERRIQHPAVAAVVAGGRVLFT
jgi:hypothetical protein